MSECAVRTYQEGDEIELTSLFNEAYQSYAGFVPRTPEYWLWSRLNRPDVENEGTITLVHERKIVAYVVVGKSGNIWELCFDRAHNKEAFVSLILEKAVDFSNRDQARIETWVVQILPFPITRDETAFKESFNGVFISFSQSSTDVFTLCQGYTPRFIPNQRGAKTKGR